MRSFWNWFVSFEKTPPQEVDWSIIYGLEVMALLPQDQELLEETYDDSFEPTEEGKCHS